MDGKIQTNSKVHGCKAGDSWTVIEHEMKGGHIVSALQSSLTLPSWCSTVDYLVIWLPSHLLGRFYYLAFSLPSSPVYLVIGLLQPASCLLGNIDDDDDDDENKSASPPFGPYTFEACGQRKQYSPYFGWVGTKTMQFKNQLC